MASSNAPVDPQRSLEDLAAVTLAEPAEEIRTATRNVYLCAQAWRRSPQWTGDKLARKGYEVIAVAVADIDATPEPVTHRDVDHLVDAIAPILRGWWDPAPGPRQELFDAVERLRKAAMYRPGWVRDARRILGLD